MKKFIMLFLLFSQLLFCQDFWESIYSSEETIFCVAVDSQNNIFLGTIDGVLRSTNNGQDWELVLPVYQTKGMMVNSQDYIYASPYPLYVSTDNGDSWDQLNMTSFEDIITIFEDSQHNIFAGFWGGIYKSSNYGDDWELVLSVQSLEVVNQIVENSEGILFAGSTNYIGAGTGGVYRSIDHGDNWEIVGLGQHFISSLAINSNDDIFAGSRGHYTQFTGGVYYSSDNGNDWVELKDDVWVTSIVIDTEDNIFIGCSALETFNGGVQFSTDNGLTWQLIESEIVTQYIGIEYLAISDDNYLYAISGYGSVNQVYRSVQPVLTESNEFSVPDVVNVILTNYPNPFNPSTTISFNLTTEITSLRNASAWQAVSTEIAIYNLKGQKVKSLPITPSPSHTVSVTWDGTDQNNKPVASGIYYARLKAVNQTVIRKMLLLK